LSLAAKPTSPTTLLLLHLLFLVEGEGFEPSYSERTDLQSVAFNHSATPPNRTRDYAYISTFCQMLTLKNAINNHCVFNIRNGIELVPGIGIELMTFALQVRCSTN
jgi:hypothetical protein